MMTTPAELPRVHWLGRPVKPLAVGLIIALIGVTLNIWLPVAEPSGFDCPLGWIACGTLATMFASWARRSQITYEWALLFTAGVFTARAVGVWMVTDYFLAGILPFSVAVLAGGSYILERADNIHIWGR